MKHFPLLLAVAILLAAPAIAAAPQVLTTIKPIHSLTAAVMDGVGKPMLLIEGAQSVHSYALKPSDARKIRDAKLIFTVGLGLENFLDAPLKALAHGKVVTLAQAPGVKLLPARHGGLWQDEHAHHDHGGFDPHIWLDPANAIAMTRAIAAALSEADPAHAATYRANAKRAVDALTRLDGELRHRLAGLQGKRYLVFHDAYRYFEAHYGIGALGAVAVSPERPPGTRRVAELRRAIASQQAVCIFREPQFPPKLIQALTEGTPVRVGTLDPLGADLAPGPLLYPTLLNNLAQSLAGCLRH